MKFPPSPSHTKPVWSNARRLCASHSSTRCSLPCGICSQLQLHQLLHKSIRLRRGRSLLSIRPSQLHLWPVLCKKIWCEFNADSQHGHKSDQPVAEAAFYLTLTPCSLEVGLKLPTLLGSPITVVADLLPPLKAPISLFFGNCENLAPRIGSFNWMILLLFFINLR